MFICQYYRILNYAGLCEVLSRLVLPLSFWMLLMLLVQLQLDAYA